jgi:uncharacterized protein
MTSAMRRGSLARPGRPAASPHKVASMTTPGPPDGDGSALRARLDVALRASLRARDQVAIAALRTALAAIANAEAVPAGEGPGSRASSPHVAGAATGLGAGEAARRALSEEAMTGIVQAEVADRIAAAQQYERSGRGERAERLTREAAVLQTVLDRGSPDPSDPGTT